MRVAVEIVLNGERKSIDGPVNVIGLLESLGVNPKTVAVERNLKIVARSDYAKEMVEGGDSVEIIRFVGGG